MAAQRLLYPRRQLLARSFLLALSLSASALSLSVPPIAIGGRSTQVSSAPIKRPPSSCMLFSTSSTRALVTTRVMAGTQYRSSLSPSDATFQSIYSSKRLALALLFKITRCATKLRRSVLRTTAILSFLLFGVTLTASAPPARARPRGSPAAVVAPDTTATKSSSAAAKCVKVVVAAGAVTAGVLVARSLEGNNDGADDEGGGDDSAAWGESNGVLNVVPKTKPSPLPLSAEWIAQQLKDAEKETAPPATAARPPPRPAAPPPAAASGGSPNTALVKDLDAKIERLRVEEERARAASEEQLARDLERARAETDAKAAAAAAAAAAEAAVAAERAEAAVVAERAAAAAAARERADAADAVRRQAEQEREAARERELEELERGKSEQARLERRRRAAAGEGREDGGGSAPAADVARARRQPQPLEEERKLKEKYGGMDDVGERAFNILVDLGMVEVHSDPDAASSPLTWEDDEDESTNAFM